MLLTILLVSIAIVIAVILFLAIGSRIEDEKKSEKGLKHAVKSFGQYTEKVEYRIGSFILHDEPTNRLLIGNDIIDDRIIMRMATQEKDPELYVASTKKQFKTKTDTGSVIGRSLTGGLIAGPVGAVIGGTTASKTTEIVEKPQYSMTVGQYYIMLYDDKDVFCGMIGTSEKKKYEAAILFFSKLIERNQKVKSESQKKAEIPGPIPTPVIVAAQAPPAAEMLPLDGVPSDLVEKKPIETVRPEEASHEPNLPLPKINHRDDLPRFKFPESTVIKELSHLREEWNNPDTMRLPVAIGRDENAKVKIIDLAKTANLLVAGSRTCYDSVVLSLKTVVYSLLMTKHPSEVKFVLLDAHRLEFMGLDKLFFHYLACLPSYMDEEEEREECIITSSDEASHALLSLTKEVEERLGLLQKARCRNIEQYNERYQERQLLPTEGHHYIPYLVVVVNEFAEFVSLMNRNVQPYINQIVRIAHKGQSVGIHLVLGTTYILREFIPSELIDCFPGVLSYRVNSWSESKILLGEMGAESQSGSKSFIFKNDGELSTLHNLDIAEKEFERVVDGVGKQFGYQKSYNTPFYLPETWDDDSSEAGRMFDMRTLDERFEEAARLIVTSQRGSTADLQRRLGMGYAKAGRVMDQLEAAGIVGPQNGSKPREVLVKDFKELDQILSLFFNGKN